MTGVIRQNVSQEQKGSIMTTAEKIPTGKRITGDERAQLSARVVRLYQAGTGIRAIAEQTGRSYGAIHRLLTEAEVARRPRGGVIKTAQRSA